MTLVRDVSKRILLGRKLRSDRLHETLLPKRIALPVFASDALSSVAYAPDEIFLTLSIAGLAAVAFSWPVGLAVAVVMLTVVASYRQNVRAYPSGGGDYEVATVNLGPRAGLVVASALIVDYVLTVAVSISSASAYASAAIPVLRGHEVGAAVAAVAVLMLLNLRGVRESGALFAAPTYLFMIAILGMSAWGAVRYAGGGLPMAPSADLELVAQPGVSEGIVGLAGAFLLLRAFSTGCAALTGVEAISNGVPAFRKPKSRNAATTLLLLALLSVTMLISVITLANVMDVRYADDPATQLLRDGVPVGDEYHQVPVIGQLAQGVFDHFGPGYYLVSLTTGLILVLAANTAFNGAPVLGSILARDGFLPHQLDRRGDRLAYSNGIVALAAAACGLIIALDADVTHLIQLYVVGVFVSFTLSQLGMVRHWTRLLRDASDAERGAMIRARAVNTLGLAMTSTVLVVVLATKFVRGAWISVLAMMIIFAVMTKIRRHYDEVSRELAGSADPLVDQALPSRVHAIVLVSKVHRPTLRTVAYARASRPSTIEAVTVDVDAEDTKNLVDGWDQRALPVPLKILHSPYREITRPVVDYVRGIRRESPRDLVSVYIPEYVVGHWWEHLLHNQSALRLKSRLLFTPGVMVVSVPWQLESSAAAAEQKQWQAPGSVRLGEPAGLPAPSRHPDD